MPNPKVIVKKVVEKFEKPKTAAVEWGDGLSKQYKSQQVDKYEIKNQLKGMFDPSQSKFADIVVEFYRRLKRK